MDYNSLNSDDLNYLEQLLGESIQDESFNGSPGRSKAAVSIEPEIDTQLYQEKQSKVNGLIWAFREIGYIHANLNPLGNYITKELQYLLFTQKGYVGDLSLDRYGLTEDDLELEFNCGKVYDNQNLPLKWIVNHLRETYCRTLGVEILHIQNLSMRNWLIRNLEIPDKMLVISDEMKRHIQQDLIRAEEFERFINTKFIGQKRFSLEGGEAVIPALKYLFREAIQLEAKEIVIGMAHRGRLNVLTNAISKPAADIFAMFQDNYQPYIYGGSGDVKYHMGQSCDFFDDEGRSIHISLVANPSHLEAVNPVVEGKTRGIQRRRNDKYRKKVIPVLIHGDAAFSGQGIVFETLNLSQLKGYRTGGTIHIIINNQIGFTTSSRDSRSTFFTTDIAKALPIPIFHANGDDPEAVVRAMDLAIRWRIKFSSDAVVDIVCYRRLGHNEADEPSFTHPIMYKLIKGHDSVTQLYQQRLIDEGVSSSQEIANFKAEYIASLEEALEEASHYEQHSWNDAFRKGDWKGLGFEYFFDFPHTGVDEDTLLRIGNVLTTIPDNFLAHSKLKRFVKGRKDALDSKLGIDWAFAESLAFGSLLLDGYHVRLSGEDCSRGTFSQRHSRWWDVSADNPKSYVPLMHVGQDTGVFSVYDSPLSEFAVLGFEYGYSLSMPKILVLWEAQFGDFANGAQTIIDQFISSGEKKWFRSSGLVMLLPHGYEGQGPEHSNAYLERYLTLCAEENMQVCNLTTPAQYFHVLRKQMIQLFRKPLIIMTPKSLLRHKLAVSELSDFTQGKFQTVLNDEESFSKASQVIMCTGKVYYDLLKRRSELNTTDTAIVRLEQLYPFPSEKIIEILDSYKNALSFTWVQEEPKNRGAWGFVEPLLQEHTSRKWRYTGRCASASPSTGAHEKNLQEVEEFLTQAFNTKG